jgi:hypothetical protein
MSVLSVREIVHKGGGPKRLHEKSKGLAKQRCERVIAEKTIYSWFENGIPEKHWWLVMLVCHVKEGDLHRANEALRRARPKPRTSDASQAAA